MPAKKSGKFQIRTYLAHITMVFLLVVGLICYGVAKRSTQVANVNLVTSRLSETRQDYVSQLAPIASGDRYAMAVRSPAPAGCYYKQVECFKAPCDPILVCQSPVPSPTPRSSCLPYYPCPSGAYCVAPADWSMYCSPTPMPSKVPVPSPIPSLRPSPSPTTVSGVATVTLSQVCGTGGFLSMAYQCNGGSMRNYQVTTCTSASVLQQKARLDCQGQ